MKKAISLIILFVLIVQFFPSKSYASDQYLRVRIQAPIKSNEMVNLRSNSGFSIGLFDGEFKELKRISVENINVIHNDNSIIILDLEGNILFSYEKRENVFITSTNQDNPIVGVENNNYRDYISFLTDEKGLVVINITTLDHYLYGVVPKEMPYSFPIEALKVQAIAARNFALNNIGKHSKNGYDLCDSTDCQVYGGLNFESNITNKAVDETKGVLMKYNDEIVNASYHSNSGGHTEDCINVWGRDVPYLKGVDDPFSVGQTNSQWKYFLSLSDIKESLQKNGIDIGDIKNLEIVETTNYGRVSKLRVIGSIGEYVLEKEKIRQVFGYTTIKSNWFNIKPIGNENNNSGINVVDGYSLKPKNVDMENVYTIDGNGVVQNIKGATKNILSANGEGKVSFVVQSNNEVGFAFEGKGYGHGVGMSQWGAKGMAELGYSYEEILKYYYKDIYITKENM